MLFIALAMGVDILAAPESTNLRDLFALDWSNLAEQIINAAYATIAWSFFGTSIGKRVFSLYVVRPDGSKLSPGRALGRYLLTALSGVLLGIGYLMVAFRKDKRALHDLLAGTYVVRR